MVILIILSVLILFAFLFALVIGPFRTFFWNVPSLAGFPVPKRYLVLLQNNSELRPSGGFISGFGTVRMFWGIPLVNFSDSYTLDTGREVVPPYPFEKLIGDDPFYSGWQFRDANFSPDFPTSAKQVMAFYAMTYPDVYFDGVVALDFHVVEDLLRVFGSISVDSERFTADNFFMQIQRLSKDVDLHNEEALRGRKGFLAGLAKSLVREMMFSPLHYRATVSVLKRNLDEKHIQFFSQHESLQKKIVRKGWDGVVSRDTQEDFLHVNVANIGGRKADRYMQRAYEYTVTFPFEGVPHVKLIETFTHQGDYNLQSDRYQAYVRTYVPMGAKLTGSDTDSVDKVQFGEEFGTQYFGNTLVMMPGERRVFVYEYDLPATIIADNYTLRLVKQAGTDADNFRVTVRMPNDYSVLSEGSDEPFSVRENIAVWNGNLRKDLVLRVQKQADSSSPLIQWQTFRDPKTIEIRFNEKIDPASVTDLSNFSVTDDNYANLQKDSITVTGARLSDMDLLLTLSGIQYAPGERYSLTLKHVSDLSGNVIQPDPKTVTVVQK